MPPNSRNIARSVPLWAGLFCITLGCLVLLGWAMGIEALKSVLPGHATMRPNTAIAFLLSGVSVLAFSVRQRWPYTARWALWMNRACSGTLTILALLTALEYLFGINLGIDDLIFPNALSTTFPRMAPNTAVAFLFAGIALLTLERNPTRAQIITLPIIAISYLAVLGYLFNIVSLYGLGKAKEMAMHTSVGLLVLAGAILFVRIDRGFMSMIESNSLGGYTFRKFFPFALLSPLIVELIEHAVITRRDVDPHIGVALDVLILSSVSLAITWKISKRVHLLDIERTSKSEELSNAIARLRFVQEAMETAAHAVHLDELLDKLLKKICTITKADLCAALLSTPDETQLQLRKSVGLGEEKYLGMLTPANEGISGKILKTGTGVLISDTAEMPFSIPLMGENNIQSMIGIPIHRGSKVIGVIYVGSQRPAHFSTEDLAIVRLIADRIGSAIDRAQLLESEILSRQQTEKTLALRNEFISIASHELKTPLTSLKLQCQLLNRAIQNGKTGEQVMESVSKMLSVGLRQFDRLTRLVDDMLDISRISAGKLRVEREITDLREMIESVVDHLSELIASAGCALTLNLESGVIANVDRFRMEQVIINLLGNAVKYGKGHPIEISLKKIGGTAEISVRDHGIGISEEDQHRIFERFERSSQASEFGGMGLGLYIAKEIVALHDGSIRVKSRRGEGATFTVRFPLKLSGRAKEAA